MDILDSSPEYITKLAENEIFVFGSNQGGKHGAGAAKQALGFGAKWGQADGLQGRTYGIPTKDHSIRRTLSIDEIKPYVDRFIQCAINHPELTFLVTEIGCGLAGLKPKEVAPLFEVAINLSNVKLPRRFIHKLSNIQIDDSLEKYKDAPIFQDKLDKANEILSKGELPKSIKK
jgi:hypothetical protein